MCVCVCVCVVNRINARSMHQWSCCFKRKATMMQAADGTAVVSCNPVPENGSLLPKWSRGGKRERARPESRRTNNTVYGKDTNAISCSLALGLSPPIMLSRVVSALCLEGLAGGKVLCNAGTYWRGTCMYLLLKIERDVHVRIQLTSGPPIFPFLDVSFCWPGLARSITKQEPPTAP